MGKHKNAKQDAVFLEFLEAHPDIASGSTKGDATDSFWYDLVNELNSCGPPMKDTNGWKKALLDWRSNIKKKITHNRKIGEDTGMDGGYVTRYMLSPIEDRIAKVCGLYQSTDGIKPMESIDCEETNSLDRIENSSSSNEDKENDSATKRPGTPTMNSGSALKKRKETTNEISHSIIEKSSTMNRIVENLDQLNIIVVSNNAALNKLCDLISEQNSEMKRHNSEIEKALARDHELRLKQLEIEEMRLVIEQKKVD